MDAACGQNRRAPKRWRAAAAPNAARGTADSASSALALESS